MPVAFSVKAPKIDQSTTAKNSRQMPARPIQPTGLVTEIMVLSFSGERSLSSASLLNILSEAMLTSLLPGEICAYSSRATLTFSPSSNPSLPETTTISPSASPERIST